jgi:hypothetical protein
MMDIIKLKLEKRKLTELILDIDLFWIITRKICGRQTYIMSETA